MAFSEVVAVLEQLGSKPAIEIEDRELLLKCQEALVNKTDPVSLMAIEQVKELLKASEPGAD